MSVHDYIRKFFEFLGPKSWLHQRHLGFAGVVDYNGPVFKVPSSPYVEDAPTPVKLHNRRPFRKLLSREASLAVCRFWEAGIRFSSPSWQGCKSGFIIFLWKLRGRRSEPRVGDASGREGQVAQLVEHWTENPGVGGSIPPLSTMPHGGDRR